MSGIEPTAVDENREACEQRLLRLGEQVVTPGDRRLQGALAFVDVAAAAGQ